MERVLVEARATIGSKIAIIVRRVFEATPTHHNAPLFRDSIKIDFQP